jgi:hypothetical protein
MQKSEQINELALALSRFQGEVRDAEKDSKAYNYKYAKLDQLFDIVRPILCKHGLSFIQPAQISSGQELEVETWILHESGQYISSSLKVPTDFESKNANDLQKIGMAISYAKRYAIMGMLGLCQKDEDNDGASGITNKPEFQRRESQGESPKITKQQEIDLIALITEKGRSQERLCNHYKVNNIADLTVAEFNSAIAMLNKGEKQ